LLHVLVGEDDFSIRQSLEQIKKSIGDASALMTNTTVLDGRQVTLEQLRGACGTVPFLSEKRLVIIEGLLERFDPGGRATKKKSSRKKDRQDEFKAIADCIGQLPEFTELVLISGKINDRNPLFRELSAMTKINSFPLLREPQLRQWIERRVAGAGGSISPQAVVLLVRFVGSDLWIMANEIDKLILFAGSRRIEEEDYTR